MTFVPLAAVDERLHLETDRIGLLLHRLVLRLRSQWDADPLHGQPVVSDEEVDALLQGPSKFHTENGAIAALEGRIQELESQIEAHRKDHEHPLDTLAKRLSLSTLDQEILRLILAPNVRPTLRTLFAYVQDDPSLDHPTVALLEPLLCRPDTWIGLHPDGPLRRLGILHLDSIDPGAALRLDERTLWHLRGLDTPDPTLHYLLEPLPPAPLTHRQDESMQALGKRLAEPQNDLPAVLHLHGATASGRRACAAALARMFGLGLQQIHHDRLPSDPAERAKTVQALHRDALLGQAALLLEGAAPSDMVRTPPVLTFLISDGTLRPDHPALSVPVPAPEHKDRVEMWRQALGAQADGLQETIEALSQRIRLGATDAMLAVQDARLRASLHEDHGSKPLIRFDDLWNAARDRLLRDLGTLARRIEPRATWNDLVVPEPMRQQLLDLAGHVEHQGLVFDDWGARSRIRTGLGVTALFAGPSGTGKTLAAEVIAHHLGLDLQRVNLAGMVSKYIGETEKNLDKVFDAAERSGAVLFFDEADALFGKRTTVSDSHDRYANLEVDHLLQRMEDYSGLAVLATNRKGDLDRAFLRRIRFVLEFPQPDQEARRMIWSRLLPPDAPRDEDVDLDALARLELSGGGIRNVALNAAFLAAPEGALGARHLQEAARREFIKMDRRPGEAELVVTAHGGARA